MANEVKIVIAGDSKKLENATAKSRAALGRMGDEAERARGRFATAFAGIGTIVAATAVKVGASIARDIIGAAANLEQSIGGVDAVFKDNAATMHEWARGAADNLGLSENAANEFAAVLGAQLKNAGQPLDQVAAKTQTLVALGADLAATYGGTTADAVGALSSALKGENDPIERFGITLNQAALQAKALELGIDGASSTWDVATKQQVILAAITDQSTDAMGQFAAQSDTVAEKQQKANAKWENAKAALGQKLLPVVSAATGVLSKMAGFVAENADVILPLVGVIAAVTAAQLAWNLAMSLNPAGLLVIGIAAVIAGVLLLIKHFDEVKTFFSTVWHGIADAVSAPFKAAFEAIKRFWNEHIGGKGFDVPSWVPFGAGGKSFRFPKFHSGGVVPQVPGGEMLAVLQSGETVIPASQSGRTVLEVRGPAEVQGMLKLLIRRIVAEGGGSAQVVFSR